MLFILRKDDFKRGDVLCNLISALKELPVGKSFTVTVQASEAKRSKQQNAYFHALRDLIAKETGQDRESLKKHIKKSVLGYEKFTDKDGQEFLILRETSDLNIEEYNNLIDATMALAMELNINIPPPRRFGYDL